MCALVAIEAGWLLKLLLLVCALVAIVAGWLLKLLLLVCALVAIEAGWLLKLLLLVSNWLDTSTFIIYGSYKASGRYSTGPPSGLPVL